MKRMGVKQDLQLSVEIALEVGKTVGTRQLPSWYKRLTSNSSPSFLSSSSSLSRPLFIFHPSFVISDQYLGFLPS